MRPTTCLRLLFSVLILIAVADCFASYPERIDSLRKELAKVTVDTIKAEILVQLSGYYSDQDMDSAIYFAKLAQELGQQMGDEIVGAKAMTRVGVGYSIQDNYPKALEYLLQAQKIFEEYGDKYPFWLSIIYTEYGIINLRESEYEKSIENHKIAMKYKYQRGDTISVAKTYNNIAGIFERRGLLDSSLYYHKKSLAIKEKKNFIQGMGFSKVNMSSIYFKKDKYDTALTYSQEALDHFREVNDLIGRVYAENMVSDSYRMLGNLEGALEYRKLNLETAKLIKSKTRIEEGYRKTSEIFAMMGRFKEAYEYRDLGAAYRDSVFNEQNVREQEQLRANFEIEKREEEIARQEAELNLQSTLRNALIGGLLLLAIIGALIYRNQRSKAKSLEEKEALLKEIHHRVKNNLQVISSLLNMQSRGVEDEQMQEVIKEGQSRVRAMSLIHQKLYQTENLTEIDFQEYIQQLLDQLQTLYQNDAVDVSNAVNAEGVRLDIDTAIPLGLILNELISNAYKYAFEGTDQGRIEINLERLDKDQLQLEVRDNGRGLPTDFNLDGIKSLGLKLVNILTKQLQGTLNFTSDSGTSFRITFNEVKMST